MDTPKRILVTGSRDWTDHHTIERALTQYWADGTATLVHGGCPRGADRIAHDCWTRWGGHTESHPADWKQHGAHAGPRRNAAMVRAGADICLAFIRNNSHGARQTAVLAQHAGIPTCCFEQQDEPPSKC